MSVKQDQLRLGFLTAIEVPDQGYVGGLLVTNRHGRPLEFQCTAPVKPNRTQEILYGPTLGPFLLGELIGRALIEKSGIKPHLILTERAEILELRQHIEVPVACLTSDAATLPAPSAGSENSTSVSSIDLLRQKPVATGGAREHGEQGEALVLRMGRQFVRFHSAHSQDCQAFTEDATLIPRDADLREPFERVREALQETVRSGTLK